MASEYVLNEACCMTCGTPGSTGCECDHDEELDDELDDEVENEDDEDDDPSDEEEDEDVEEVLDLYVDNSQDRQAANAADETPAQARFRRQNREAEAAANQAALDGLGQGFGDDPEEMPPWTPETLTNNSAGLEVLDLDTVAEEEAAEHLAHVRKLKELGLRK